MSSRFTVGLDLGQMQDYTAIAVIEAVGNGYHCRHLERAPLGTSYPAIVQCTKELMQAPEIASDVELVVDATGVGVAVTDLLEQAGLRFVPVSITGGDRVIQDGNLYKVPKRDLVAAVQVLLQEDKLQFAEGMALVDTLVKELLDFKVKINPQTAHDSYGAWREGSHDDLVLALALAVWAAERFEEMEAW